MQRQLKAASKPRAFRPDWLPQRSPGVRRHKLCVEATTGAAPPPNKNLPEDTITRQYRRTVYDFALWAKHRNVNRYLYNLTTIPGSRIIRTLIQPMGVVLAWSALFGFYETCLETGILPASLPKLTLMSAEPQGLTSFALSLLLVFRTNSSYGRFDEARKIWGGILNRARNIANQAVSFTPPESAAGRLAVAKWTVGFCRALQAHLQEDADLRSELLRAQPAWSEQEVELLCAAQHRPIKAISMLSELTRQLPLSQLQALQMQENVTFFYDALGGCERLLRTPLPLSYTRHTARFLTIWLALLPLGLWERYHWSMLPVIALIGVLLLGIDEIGITIEEPFGILPLDAICTRAQTDVMSLVKEDADVAQYVTAVLEQPPPSAAPAAPPPPAASAQPSPPQQRQPQQPPGVVRAVTSLLTNVKAGIGPVAPGAPPPPVRPPSPRAPSPKARSYSPRAGSPGKPNPFPPASAGTGRAPPAPPPPPSPQPPRVAAVPRPSSAGASAPPVSRGGYVSKDTGMGLAAAAARAAKDQDASIGIAAGAVGSPARAFTPPALPGRASITAAEGRDVGDSSYSSISSGSGGDEYGGSSSSGSSRLGSDWRTELAAAFSAVAATSASDDGWSRWRRGADVDADDADSEALRRFGGLAGRMARNASSDSGSDSGGVGGSDLAGVGVRYGNGNGVGRASNGGGSSIGSRDIAADSSLQRPRTRPDWRDRL
ncbi:hypothetical protein Agub_g3113 [Astrephomene gubernaculifera]|uniref:Uncharacterized protein n=1 Tax=Astrephomene gubernaculifera TaxID=47775 RepID=A0AAD3DI34_9CHLO|nr:hypothetical protein Agub_g3113 [Astrephomene gubernaculifera]